MAKAAVQPVWYDEYYQTRPGYYIYEHWTCLLAGGRVNIHPFYPRSEEPEEEGDFRILPILRGGADRIRSRTRLLNFVMQAPLQCPVAVVFGHWGVMNWTYPQYFDSLQAAITLCNELARRGYPAARRNRAAKRSGWTRRLSFQTTAGRLFRSPQKRSGVLACRPSHPLVDLDLSKPNLADDFEMEGMTEPVNYVRDTPFMRQGAWDFLHNRVFKEMDAIQALCRE